MEKYTQDGVSLQEGDSFSSFAGSLCQSTFNNNPFVEIIDFSKGHFRGPRGWRFKNLPEGCFFDSTSDGIGTKVVLISASQKYEYAARDLIAMTCMDITRWGGLPLIANNILDVNSLGDGSAFREMIIGFKKAVDELKMVMFRGETAEIGPCVGLENPESEIKFNWGGTVIGAYYPDLMITGDSLEPGQIVIALRELGFRSNGISSVRKAFANHFGPEWWSVKEAKDFITLAATPSVLYDLFLANVNGWLPWMSSEFDFTPLMKVHLITHITGGGIKSKFADDILFRKGLSANLDNLWDPPQIMRDCAIWRGMSDEECYTVWNGGQGALVVLNPKDAKLFIDFAKEFEIEAQVAGEITKESSPVVRIISKFNGEEIKFPPS